jgi:hypothetical protein
MEATNMKNVLKKVDYQQEIDPHRFIRQVGKKPLLSQPKYKTHYEPELFAETFGPPEMEMNDRRQSGILFWNFVDQNGKAAFSMFAEFPAGQKAKDARDVPVYLSASRSSSTAYLWTADRLAAVEAGDELPLLVGAAKFVVSRVC